MAYTRAVSWLNHSAARIARARFSASTQFGGSPVRVAAHSTSVKMSASRAVYPSSFEKAAPRASSSGSASIRAAKSS